MAISRFLFELRSPSIARRILAALVAPPLAMVLYGIMMPLWLRTGSIEQVTGMTLIVVIIGSIFAYAGMVLVGFPTNITLRWLNAERGITYILMGAATLPLVLALKDPTFPSVEQFTLAAAPGGLVAGLWWLVATRQPPLPTQ